jgi:hypothetical protein
MMHGQKTIKKCFKSDRKLKKITYDDGDGKDNNDKELSQNTYSLVTPCFMQLLQYIIKLFSLPVFLTTLPWPPLMSYFTRLMSQFPCHFIQEFS